MGQKVDINLKNSLNTNTIAEDIRGFQDAAAPALQNTGIERDGGITNVYETKEDYSVAGDHFITEDGNTLQSVVSGDQRLISVDGRQIGIASAYGVGSRQAFQGVDDAAISSTGTILTAAVKGSGIEVNEYSATGALLNTRVTTFTNLAAVLQFFTSLSIIRYQGIKFADQLEFALRLGDQIILLKEATPAMSISKAFTTSALRNGGMIIRAAIVYLGFLVVAGDGGDVASFDGLAWRYSDGSGGGKGPYNDGTAMGANNIYTLSQYTQNGAFYLIAGGVGGRLCSFANGVWNAYNKAGTGPWNNATAIGANDIRSICPISVGATNYLAVAGAGGRLGSYSTAGGWIVYTAGAGLRNNGTLIGANAILTMQAIKTGGGESVLVVAGVGGRVGSQRYTGGAWNTAVYTAGSTADNPTNNATVCGANDINCSVVWGVNDIVFGAAGGAVGHWHAYAWYNYNGAGGAGVCINNAVAVGINNIAGIAVFNSTIVIQGQGLTASWDGANWKNYDGTGVGTGLYDDSNYLRAGTPAISLQNFLSQLVFISGGLANSVTGSGLYSPVYFDGGASYCVSLFEKIYDAAYLYMYKYENAKYIMQITGNTSNITSIIDPAALTSNTIAGRYLCLQVSGGKSRHIITCTPDYPGSAAVIALGYIGYTDFVAYSAAIVFPENPQSVNQMDSYAIGINYAEVEFYLLASPSNRFHYLPRLIPTPSELFQVVQSQNKVLSKSDLINAYGKITGGAGVVPSVPLELRGGFIGGVASFYSAAVLDGIKSDTMGALLTNVGEIDPSYTPDFKDDRILYRYNGQFFYIVLSKTLTGNVFQKISEKVYKINTISPLNILSMIDQRLHVGSSDYHGQMIFESTAAPAAVATNIASVLAGAITADPLAENIYSNSIDVGNKLCYITAPTSANISLVGYRIPFGYQSIQEIISTYIADIYAFSTANDGSELVLTDPNNPAYLEDTRLPVAIGLAYNNGAVNNGQSTIFLKPDYDGYEIGNEAKGVYVAFQLFGTTYLFDGVTIFQANFSNGIYGGKIEIAPAVGMSFLAATPNQAYFLSPFDNSVYVFNGGRSLAKFQRLSQMPAVLRGIFSTRDNTLLLETATSFIWVRDEIVTQNLKSVAQTALKLYDTTLGLIIGNDASRWRYGYASLSGASVVLPIIWQSSYYGQTSGQRSNLEQFFATIYSATKAAQIITAKVDAFDEKAHYAQTVTFPVKPSDYSSAGYYRFRVKPKTQKTLGTSLTLAIPAKAVLSDVYLEYSDDAAAVVTGNATR